MQLLSRVVALKQQDDRRWLVAVQKNDLSQSNSVVRARYVFAGAGGGSAAGRPGSAARGDPPAPQSAETARAHARPGAARCGGRCGPRRSHLK